MTWQCYRDLMAFYVIVYHWQSASCDQLLIIANHIYIYIRTYYCLHTTLAVDLIHIDHLVIESDPLWRQAWNLNPIIFRNVYIVSWSWSQCADREAGIVHIRISRHAHTATRYTIWDIYTGTLMTVSFTISIPHPHKITCFDSSTWGIVDIVCSAHGAL